MTASQLALFGSEMIRGAQISKCGRYRYELTRRWSDGPLLEFIMLNPSTANASVDDATIRRCIAFAASWGYGGIVVRNLFAYRATDPRELFMVDDPIGPRNEQYLADDSADCTIVAWGANKAASGWWSGKQWRRRSPILRSRGLFCLGTNAGGSPKHPLYVCADREPVQWRVAA